jgi:hypothetical protein
LLAFLAGARVSCRRAGRGQAGAPAALAPVRARARTNELEAGKRQPMIGSEEGGLAVRVARGCVGPSEWSHIHPFGACPAGRRHDRAIRGRAAQSVLRARRGRLRSIFELARGLATLRPVTCGGFPTRARRRVAAPRARRR